MTQDRKRTYRKKPVDNISAAATEMGNVPPQATDIEEAVLGAMMINTESVDQVMDMQQIKLFSVKTFEGVAIFGGIMLLMIGLFWILSYI